MRSLPSRYIYIFFTLIFAILPHPISFLRADTVILQNGSIYRNVKTRLSGNFLEISGPLTRRIPVQEIKSIIPGEVHISPAAKNKSDPDDLKKIEETEEDSEISDTFLYGPLPGWSPLIQQGYTTSGIIVASGEIVSSLFFASHFLPLVEKDFNYYLYQSALVEFLFPVTSSLQNGGSGQGQPSGESGGIGSGTFSVESVIQRAFFFAYLDKKTTNPVRDPLFGGYISEKHFASRRMQSGILLGAILGLDTLTATIPLLTEEEGTNTERPSLSLNVRIQPESGFNQRFTTFPSLDRSMLFFITMPL